MSSTDQGGGKRRVFSLRDTRNASNTPNNVDAHARIDRVHNHNSRATTGPRPGLRSHKTPTDGYEHKANSRNNEIPTCPRSLVGGGDGGGPSVFFRPMLFAQTERLYSGSLHSWAT
jgi:hypothetical protein